MDDNDKLLIKNHSLFYGLNNDELSKILSFIELRTYQEHDLICQEGEPTSDIYIITMGEIEVLKNVENGKSSYRITTLKDGSIIGEMALLNKEQPRSATTRALSQTKLLVIPTKHILSLKDSDLISNQLIYYKIIENIARELGVRISNTNKLVIELLTHQNVTSEQLWGQISSFAFFG